MRVSLIALATSAFAACCLLAGEPAMAQYTSDAARVIDKARKATGGSGWNSLAGLHTTGRQGDETFEVWVDPLRYGLRDERTSAAGKHVQGYNGFGEWRVLPGGESVGSAEEADLREVRSDAFFAASGYFYPGRFDQRASYVGARQSQGRSFDVLRIEPVGGEARELWFDQRTGQLGVMVDEVGPRQGRTEFSDYRKAGNLSVPFKTVLYARGASGSAERVATSIEAGPVDRSLFSLPREP